MISPALSYALQTFELSHKGLHGIAHWQNVYRFGTSIAILDPRVNRTVVELFAALHDMCRVDEGYDIHHGRRAADLVHRMDLGLSDDLHDLLWFAIKGHSDGRTSPNPTIGACWDADRLDLPRLGMKVNPKYLSTKAAKDLLLTLDRRGNNAGTSEPRSSTRAADGKVRAGGHPS